MKRKKKVYLKKKPEEKVEPKIEEKKQENVSPKQENSSKIENNFEIIPNKRDEEKNKFINIIDKHEEKKEDAPINEKKEDIPIKIDEILAKINQIQDKKIEEQKSSKVDENKKEEIKNNEENKEIKTQVENILGAFTKESENIPPKLMIEEVKEKTEKKRKNSKY